MVKTRIEIEVLAQHYVAHLKGQGIEIEKVIVFGSYSKGTATESSDIDLAFISNDFDRFNLLERQGILSKCRPGLERTDVLAYSPTMLEKRKHHSPLIQHILSEGKTVFPVAA